MLANICARGLTNFSEKAKKSFTILSITKKLVVRYSNKDVSLPENIQSDIDVCWNELIAGGKTYQCGEVFTVTKRDVSESSIDILVEKTDYAHYLYCQNIDSLGGHVVHIIHTAALVETADGLYCLWEDGTLNCTRRHVSALWWWR